MTTDTLTAAATRHGYTVRHVPGIMGVELYGREGLLAMNFRDPGRALTWLAGKDVYLSCPRTCGTGMDGHYSSDLLPDGSCDTEAGRAASEVAQIGRWMRRHGLLDLPALTAADVLAAIAVDRQDAVRENAAH